MEGEPLLNAGIGACLNLDGVVELDAGVMEGTELRAGGVAGLGREGAPRAAFNTPAMPFAIAI